MSQYQVGGSLPPDFPTYVRRKADEDLYNGLKSGQFCYVLNCRQMGKSSLRVQTMKRLQADGIACAAIDLNKIGSQHITPDQWYASLIRNLVSSFNLGDKFNLRNWWPARDHLSSVQRFSEFTEEVLLTEISASIVIFVDEIDSVLGLNFTIDDFFAFIRACYNKRADKPEYKRLSFALLGVATPSDLITDKNRTPFNIGRAIELKGFQLHEAGSLAIGLSGKVSDTTTVLKEILAWTGGQPFLTQKVCQLILSDTSSPNYLLAKHPEREAESIEDLVRSRIIENWENQDEPEHLRTISDRIFKNGQRTARLLGLYHQILQQGELIADDSSEQMELRLSGLVVEEQGKLKVYNRIYECVFNQNWVEKELENLRPYSEGLTAWLASDCQDRSRLLHGQALQDALAWAAGKSLSDRDYQFLAASQELDKLQVQIALDIQIEANRILAEAEQKARRTIRKGLAGLAVISVLAIAVVVWASTNIKQAQENLNQAQENLNQAQKSFDLEQKSVTAVGKFLIDRQEIEALLLGMEAGQGLKEMVKDYPGMKNYPATSPLWVLQTILDNIRERSQFIGHRGRVYSVSFSPNGKLLATVGEDGTARLWNLSGKQLAKLTGHQGKVRGVSFSPDGQRLITAGEDGTVRLWNLAGKQLAKLTGHQGKVTSISLSPNGQRLVTAAEDGIVRLWNLSGKQLAVFKGHQTEIWSVKFSPDGQRIATAGEDRTARLWNLSGKQLAVFKGHQQTVLSLSFSPDGKSLVTTGLDSTIRFWNLSGQQLAEWKNKDWVLSVSYSPDGQSLATGSADGTVRLRDLSGKQLAELNGHENWVLSVSFSPDGQSLATAGADGTARLWDLSNPQKLSRQQLTQWRGHKSEAWSVSFSPDGQRLATAGQDGKARLWNLSGKQMAEFSGHTGGVNSVTFSPDGQRLATAGNDGTVRVWNLSGQQLTLLSGHRGRVYVVSFSPDGKRLAIAGENGTARLWNFSGQQPIEFKGHKKSIWSVSFSPDGQRLATAGRDGTVRLWNLSGQELLRIKADGDGVLSVSFSPDGQRLVTTGADTTVKLWNLSGKQLDGFNTYQGGVLSAVFSPDGQRLATAGQDGTAQMRFLSGQRINEFVGHQGSVYSLSFSRDGRYLATVGMDGMVRLWRVEGLDELLKRGCDWLKNYLATYPEASKICSKAR
ncbi:AAA-like domain-containing protein [Aerosakkonema funiforme]|uniref:WD40 domain-containing protein n=1 Tax=Aerosakkonema funiforme TaxID=1246630 RepID=UPI0035BAADC2